jgi:uncharacterized protein (TIGR03083 family)
MDLDYLSAIESDANRIAERAEAAPATRVPSCPDWDLAALAGHVGWVHRMATAALTATGKPDLSQIPSAPAGEEVQFLRDGMEPLLTAMRTRKPDEPCWNFSGQHQFVDFWPRRQAHETLIHRWDAENAAGSAGELPATLAADGIDEWLGLFGAMRLRGKDTSAIGGSIHLHSTDAPGEWTLTFPESGPTVTQGHSKGDVAARGSAQGLILMIWNRIPTDDPSFEVLGDRAVLERWLELLR